MTVQVVSEQPFKSVRNTQVDSFNKFDRNHFRLYGTLVAILDTLRTTELTT